MKHREEPLRLAVYGRILRHRLQQRDDVALEHGDLVGERGVEYRVRVVLIREDVAERAAHDGGPLLERRLGGMSARPRVAHEAADEPRVRRAEPVVEIYVRARQRADENFIFFIRGDALRQPAVEAVDALDDEQLVRREAHLPPLRALAGEEVELRNVHLFARKQSGNLFVDELEVERLERLEVRPAVAVERRALAVYEIVVELERPRAYTRGEQLDAQTARRGGLAGARRPREAEQPHLGTRLYLLGDVAQHLRVQSFAEHDEVARTAVRDDFMYSRAGADVEIFQPRGVLLYEPEKLRRFGEGHGLAWV